MDWLSTIPENIQALVKDKKVIAAGFGAGPACVGQHYEEFDQPIAIEEGVKWLDRYAHVFKRARIVFDDGVTIHFSPLGYVFAKEH